MSWEGRRSPCNCTECIEFAGNLIFRSDTEKDLDLPYEEIIWIDCKRYGDRMCHNELIVCEHFEFDETKKSLVELDKSYASRFFRVYHKISEKSVVNMYQLGVDNPDISTLERLLYDRVCAVSQIVDQGYSKEICIRRIQVDTGIAGELVWRAIVSLLAEGILVSQEVEGKIYLKPAGYLNTVADALRMGKKKVMV